MGGPKKAEPAVVDWKGKGFHGEVQNEHHMLKSFIEVHKGVEKRIHWQILAFCKFYVLYKTCITFNGFHSGILKNTPK